MASVKKRASRGKRSFDIPLGARNPLNHENRGNVAFVEEHKSFYVNEGGLAKCYRGLTKVLSKSFYPDYNYKESTAAAAAGKKGRKK
jgi:hypothetical protein